MSNYNEEKAYEKAKKRLENEKGFYSHLAIYIAINIALLFFMSKVMAYAGADHQDSGFNNWKTWNTILTPLIWGIALLGHGLWVFRERSFLKNFFKKSMFSKDWEERKIKEFMDKDKF
ncbi:2TM domain-containing protein [Aquimarina sp. MAR_2010_214]|uniref:2TM domain-containing protein n=1 Tax=Aquimarina sp. MAR_2010_214 TaxID=1250026 RepID=UPI000CB3EC80|nr:2TM domain-containing protein [Aquimarina sp. MAR_2010_214]PKV50371.1 2TM domain-containing protein [Aquimarina sp. MAR_2010_214]